ncbi:MAG TPA: ABC transporter permease [Solirubrobacteraceae bacterium]|nr:ABC transporter permease [Solirubrobacteraceae bacterium]
MGRFIVRRVVGMVVVMFAVSVLTFLIFNVIPNGDPADRMAGKNSTPVQIAAIEKEWGFDKPIYTQYVTTMEKVFTGDLISYANQTNVVEEIKRGIPRTFALAIGAALMWFAMGTVLGLYTAIRAGRWTDTLVTVLALVGVSMPVFWLGALASYYLGFKLGLFPNGGYAEIGEEGLWEWVKHMILPWVVLATLFVGVYSRVLRSNVLDTINDDYVRTARAKGLTERRVMIHHVLRNSLIPIVTLWGLDFGAVLGGGAILTETVFDLQGVGQYFAESIGQLDVPPVLAVTLFGAFFIVLLNTLVDIVYAALDPRIRLS